MTLKTLADTKAEQAVIGGVLLNPGALPKVVKIIGGFHDSAFTDPRNHYVFHAMNTLFSEGKGIDPLTIRDKVESYDVAETLDIMPYLAELSGSVPTAANIEHYAGIVEKFARLRSLEEICRTGGQRAVDSEDPDEIISEIRQRLMGCETSQRQSLLHIGATLPAVMETIATVRKKGEPEGSVYTGLRQLDHIIRGFLPGEYCVLAARPSVGKSALAANIAIHAAKSGKRVLFFSLEMSAESIIERILSAHGNFNMNEYKDGYGGESYESDAQRAFDGVKDLPIFIHDGANLTWDELHSSTLLDIEKHGKAELIIIDYLQLLSLKHRNKNSSRQDEVATISRQIKQLARATKCPVVALSQLSRAGDTDRPRLSHLRESGAIEQDADYAILISRNGKMTEQGNIQILIDVAKNRNGMTGEVTVLFKPRTQQFVTMASGQRYEREESVAWMPDTPMIEDDEDLF